MQSWVLRVVCGVVTRDFPFGLLPSLPSLVTLRLLHLPRLTTRSHQYRSGTTSLDSLLSTKYPLLVFTIGVLFYTVGSGIDVSQYYGSLEIAGGLLLETNQPRTKFFSTSACIPPGPTYSTVRSQCRRISGEQ